MKNLKLIFRSLLLIALISVFAIIGCKKDKQDIITDNPDQNYDYQAAYDNSEAETISNDALNIADAVINTYNYEKKNFKIPIKYKWYCADVTKEFIKDYYKFTIDFGNTPQVCFNGRVRQGKIIVIIRGKYYYEGFTDTVRFDGYNVNGKKIEGTHTVTNIGNLTWAISAKGMKITGNDGKYHSWQTDCQRQLLINNIKDTTLSNFAYSITGQASGINSKGISYKATITKPVKKHFDCWWIESGSIVFEISNKPTITIDYGNEGECDNLATVTINGITKKFTLP